MENLEKTTAPLESENKIIIDWLSVTFFDVTPDYIKSLLGLDTPDIDWRDELCYRNGYPRQASFSNIAIRYGAENADNWTSDNIKTADQKVRIDMGIQLDMSGNGCRAFETYAYGGQLGEDAWYKLLSDICALGASAHFTRIDLAFDDKPPIGEKGILPIRCIAEDTRCCNWTGPAKKWNIQESGDQDNHLHGLTIYIGSPKSMIRMRIYDKAAERGFDSSVHWVRVELVHRHDRAQAAVQEILNRGSIGEVMCGVLRNYCCYREEGIDSNKSRWPIADYWEKLLGEIPRIRLFSAPGEEYNFKKTEDFMIAQWGQAIQAYYQIHGSVVSLLQVSRKAHPDLKPKYKKAIEEAKLQAKREQEARQKIREEYLCSYDENFPIISGQMDMADIFPISDNPGAAGPRYKIPDNN